MHLLAVFWECVTPPHIHPTSRYMSLHVISLTRPSPVLALQVTNAGVNRPGYEASTKGVRSCLEAHHMDTPHVRILVFIIVEHFSLWVHCLYYWSDLGIIDGTVEPALHCHCFLLPRTQNKTGFSFVPCLDLHSHRMSGLVPCCKTCAMCCSNICNTKANYIQQTW